MLAEASFKKENDPLPREHHSLVVGLRAFENSIILEWRHLVVRYMLLLLLLLQSLRFFQTGDLHYSGGINNRSCYVQQFIAQRSSPIGFVFWPVLYTSTCMLQGYCHFCILPQKSHFKQVFWFVYISLGFAHLVTTTVVVAEQ